MHRAVYRGCRRSPRRPSSTARLLTNEPFGLKKGRRFAIPWVLLGGGTARDKTRHAAVGLARFFWVRELPVRDGDVPAHDGGGMALR